MKVLPGCIFLIPIRSSQMEKDSKGDCWTVNFETERINVPGVDVKYPNQLPYVPKIIGKQISKERTGKDIGQVKDRDVHRSAIFATLSQRLLQPNSYIRGYILTKAVLKVARNNLDYTLSGNILFDTISKDGSICKVH